MFLCPCSWPCLCSKAVGGSGAEDIPRGLASVNLAKNISSDAPDLSRNLAWIQENNFEDKFEVVQIIG